MLCPSLVCSLLLGFADGDGAPAGPSAEVRRVYQDAAAKAGRDPDAHVRLALWCERRGMQPERVRHLALAVLNDPAHVTARGLLGFVRDGRRWLRPDAVADAVKADESLSATLAEYEAKRAATPGTAEAQWKLALWCEKNGLKAESVAHLTAVTRLEPTRAAAWKRLGCVVYDGRWMTPEQRSTERAEAEAQRKADLHYKVVLERYRQALAGKGLGRRAEAEEALASLTDPRAVRMIWKVFALGGPADQTRAVQVLGQIEGPDASRGLAMLAAAGKSADVRSAAIQTLKGRDAREHVGILIALLKKPIKYEVRPVGGPGSPGVLFVEGEKLNSRRFYAPPPLPMLPNLPIDGVSVDAFGLPVVSLRTGVSSSEKVPYVIPQNPAPTPAFGQIQTDLQKAGLGGVSRQLGDARSVQPLPGVVPGQTIWASTDTQVDLRVPIGQMIVEAQKTAEMAERQLEQDIAAIDSRNKAIREDNDRIRTALKETTGKDLGTKPEEWLAWWTDQQGYAFDPPKPAPKPTVDESVPLAYQPQPVPVGLVNGPTTVTGWNYQHSCFAGGTEIRTLDGRRPIESIRVGDVLLTEDTSTGRLAFQPVLAIFHNKPAPTLRIALGNDAVVATGIHRFWVAGTGWTMARDLKTGDLVRVVGGVARVKGVTPEKVQPVFNLEVASGHDFFVGKLGALAHDNSLVRPVEHPFDAPVATARAQ
ncbi:MAG TPA: polymorphic toxin-type HINT domain-containing protein [Isosphaeraceae bacterium]|jgi:hypothetical protein|nr:polymorphic toxin-type HINT domain-containing protein [Isosphaeraceae bacterium]